MVRIRLRRMGLRNRPTYRIVVIDSRKSRDGKYIESLGHYDPRTKQLDLNCERYQDWLGKGAQPSDTVHRLRARLRNTEPSVSPSEPAAVDVQMPDATAQPDQGATNEGND